MNLNKLLLVVLLLVPICVLAQFKPVLYMSETVEAMPEYQKGNKYQKDFLLFSELLTNTHPAFTERMKAPFDLAKSQAKYLKELASCKDDFHFKLILESIASQLHDGHTGFSVMDKFEYMFPLSVEFYDEVCLLMATSQECKEGLGKTISKINDVDIKRVPDLFRSFYSYDNDVNFRTALKRQILCIPEYWEFAGKMRNDSTLKVQFTDNSIVYMHKVKVPFKSWTVYKPVATGNPVCVRRNDGKPFSSQIIKDKSIAYLQFNSCQNQFTWRWTAKQQGRMFTPEEEAAIVAMPKFNEFLAGFFNQVRDNDIKTVAVDVRDNSGGNSMLCDELLSYLKPIDKINKTHVLMRYSDLYEQFYQSLAKEMEQSIKAANDGVIDRNVLYSCNGYKKYNGGSLFVGYNIEEEYKPLFNDDENKIFKGNIIFIQNEVTYSSAGDLMIVARDNQIGKIIGSPSSYNASSYGDILLYGFPNTGVGGFVSHKFFSRPDMTKIQDTELVPDVLIKTSAEDKFSGNDAVWKWVVDHYAIKK